MLSLGAWRKQMDGMISLLFVLGVSSGHCESFSGILRRLWGQKEKFKPGSQSWLKSLSEVWWTLWKQDLLSCDSQSEKDLLEPLWSLESKTKPIGCFSLERIQPGRAQSKAEMKNSWGQPRSSETLNRGYCHGGCSRASLCVIQSLGHLSGENSWCSHWENSWESQCHSRSCFLSVLICAEAQQGP